ncbi:MAG: hypothetical protein F4Z30_16490 [Gemmatimonadetes bacterium]|nr:hypothetical protein [Gemmatimonadota bacterium]
MSIESSFCFALDAAALEVRGQFDQLQYCELKKAIVLNDMLLIEDDAPAIGCPQGAEDRSWFKKLREGVMVHKDQVLDDPRAVAAYLTFNGHHLIRPPSKIAARGGRR